ncbi:MAG TPA: hypothetical protein VK470_13030, partial [Bacteroidota bacterium]|nr:hypothetical protein [Bacteroidota bacterium]
YAKQWWLWVTSIFVREYFDTISQTRMLPAKGEDVEYLMKFYLLEKLLKEMMRFIAKKPGKLSTPLTALLFLIGQIAREPAPAHV